MLFCVSNEKQVYPQSYAFPKRLVCFFFFLMFQVLSEVSWGGVRSGRNQGLEHGERVTSGLLPPVQSWGSDRGQGERISIHL